MRDGTPGVSIALSLGLLAVLAWLGWTVPQHHAAPPIAPESQETLVPDGLSDGLRDARPVILPPPPEPERSAPAAANEALREASPEPEAPELEQPKPHQVVKALKARPAAPPPMPDQTIAALQPRAQAPPAEPAQPPPHDPADAESTPPEGGVVRASPEVAREGRTLLRLLEYGSGPDIELAWPDSAPRRARLHRRLRDCYGMRIALMDRGERLFTAAGPAGAPWDPNLDRYSGFIRHPAGRPVPGEAGEAAQIRAHHGPLWGAHTVRLFPRNLDALLLGGLRRLVGPDYGAHRTIRAHYRLDGANLIVERVEADGRALPGRIDLGAASPSCRRASA